MEGQHAAPELPPSEEFLMLTREAQKLAAEAYVGAVRTLLDHAEPPGVPPELEAAVDLTALGLYYAAMRVARSALMSRRPRSSGA